MVSNWRAAGGRQPPPLNMPEAVSKRSGSMLSGPAKSPGNWLVGVGWMKTHLDDPHVPTGIGREHLVQRPRKSFLRNKTDARRCNARSRGETASIGPAPETAQPVLCYGVSRQRMHCAHATGRWKGMHRR
jgi:hypothetical protein